MLPQRGVTTGWRGGVGPPCWGQCRGASDRSQLGALPVTGVGDWLILLLSLHQVSLTLTDDPPPTLMNHPLL